MSLVSKIDLLILLLLFSRGHEVEPLPLRLILPWETCFAHGKLYNFDGQLHFRCVLRGLIFYLENRNKVFNKALNYRFSSYLSLKDVMCLTNIGATEKYRRVFMVKVKHKM